MIDIRKGVCPVCDHGEILEAIPFDFGDTDLPRTMAVTSQPVQGMFFSGFDPKRSYGPLRLYVCRSCGFTEWFTDDPGSIPVGHQYRTRIVRGRSRAPYR
jgi:hypothetical protein